LTINDLEVANTTLPRFGSRVRIPSPAPIKPKQLHDISNPLRNVVDKLGYLRTAVGLTFPFPLIRRGLGPAGTAGTARCSAPGWTTGGGRKIPAEARSTVRPTVSAPPLPAAAFLVHCCPGSALGFLLRHAT